MKQIIFLKKTRILILFAFIWNSDLRAQHFDVLGTFISPGNNSCTAGQIFDWGARISFPVPPGLTLIQLNYLETDFRASFPYFEFEVIIQSGCGIMYINFVTADPGGTPGTWVNSGNVAIPGNVVNFYCGSLQNMQYGDFQTLYGSSIVLGINIVHVGNQGESFDFDNTRINNITYNYDDCDGDGLLDIYDCHPNNNGNSKVYVCHNGNTICVAQSALTAHLGHGDYMGACVSYSRPVTITPEEVSLNELKLFPIPASNKINISNTINKPIGKVSIYDISGKLVYESFISSFHAIIDLKDFLPGVYLLRSEKKEKTIKFVKTN